MICYIPQIHQVNPLRFFFTPNLKYHRRCEIKSPSQYTCQHTTKKGAVTTKVLNHHGDEIYFYHINFVTWLSLKYCFLQLHIREFHYVHTVRFTCTLWIHCTNSSWNYVKKKKKKTISTYLDFTHLEQKCNPTRSNQWPYNLISTFATFKAEGLTLVRSRGTPPPCQLVLPVRRLTWEQTDKYQR